VIDNVEFLGRKLAGDFSGECCWYRSYHLPRRRNQVQTTTLSLSEVWKQKEALVHPELA